MARKKSTIDALMASYDRGFSAGLEEGQRRSAERLKSEQQRNVARQQELELVAKGDESD